MAAAAVVAVVVAVIAAEVAAKVAVKVVVVLRVAVVVGGGGGWWWMVNVKVKTATATAHKRLKKSFLQAAHWPDVQPVVVIKKTGFGWHGFFLNGFRVADTYQGFFLNCFWKLSTFAAQPPKSSQKCPHCSNRLVAPV